MANNKLVARDCVLKYVTYANPNWLATGLPDPANASEALTYFARSLSIEGSFETVDVTGIANTIVANVENKYDTRVNLSGLVTLGDMTAVRKNVKAVPKDVAITLSFFNNTPSYRSTMGTSADITFTTYARSLEINYRVESTRVDGTGDTHVCRRPIRIDGRARIEGLMIAPTSSDDLAQFFFEQEKLLRRIVKVTAQMSTGNNTYVYSFYGGVNRISVDVDNPMRQTLELTSIALGGTTGWTDALNYHDPLLELFAVDGNGNYTNLAFGIAVFIPSATPQMILRGYLGAEELTLSVTEGEVAHNLTGVGYTLGCLTID